MSLILDALRKLDREKSSRRDGTANIAVEILRPDPSRPAKKMLWYFAAVSITAVATACITYALVARSGMMSKSFPPATVNPPQSQQITAGCTSPGHVSKSTDEISRAPVKIQGSAESEEILDATVCGKEQVRDMLRKKRGCRSRNDKKIRRANPEGICLHLAVTKIIGDHLAGRAFGAPRYDQWPDCH